MAMYAFRGRSGGAVVSGEIEANDRPTAVTALRARGVVATSVQERTAKPVGIKKIGGKVKDKDLAIYTRQFSTMVDAGLPIAQCLAILSEQSDSKSLREVTAIWRAIQNGDPDLAERCCVDHVKAAAVAALSMIERSSAAKEKAVANE